MTSQANPLDPTFTGHVETTMDALVLFEACLQGRLNHVPRRPHDREREDLIRSGNVFIYEEHASGIKRWTDGVSWSPSRILGNFLIYRELEKPFPPGEKKRALKKSKKSPQGGVNKPEASGRSNSISYNPIMDPNSAAKDSERSLIGSLVDSYPFKDDGLVKKTISITYNGVPHHLVSYYSVSDVQEAKLVTPQNAINDISPRNALLAGQNFRTPIEELEYLAGDERTMNVPGYMPNYGPPHAVHGLNGMLQRHMSAPQFQPPVSYQVPGHPFPYPAPNAQFFGHGIPPQGAPHFVPPTSYYALDPTRGGRPPGSSAAMTQEYPRNMPAQSLPRRHSTFDAAGSSPDLTALTSGPMVEARHSTDWGSAMQFGIPDRSSVTPNGQSQEFPSPRHIKPELDHYGGDDGSGHTYAFDEGRNHWSFTDVV